jgi:hypothetical protein
MHIRLGLELDIHGVHPKGEVDVEFEVRPSRGRIDFEIVNLKFQDNRLYDVLGEVVLKRLFTRYLTQKINQMIADLPKNEPLIRNIEVLG